MQQVELFQVGVLISITSVMILLIQQWRDDVFNRRKHAVALQEQAAEIKRLQCEEEERRRALAELEEARHQLLPDRAVYICQQAIKRASNRQFSGSEMLVLVGTPGQKRGLDYLNRLKQAGMTDVVGSILVINFDQDEVTNFTRELPEEFADRVFYCTSGVHVNGMANRSYTEQQDLAGDITPAVQAVTQKAFLAHQRRNHNPPGYAALKASPGGHLFAGVEAIRTLKALLPSLDIVGTLSLPSTEYQRNDFLRALPDFERAGLTGWVLDDGHEFNPETSDSALADLLVATHATHLHGGASVQLNNLMRNVLRTNARVAIFQRAYQSVPAYHWQPHPALPVRYYVDTDQVYEGLRRLVQVMEQGQATPSARGPLGEEGCSAYDFLLASVDAPDILTITDRIKKAREAEIGHLTLNPQHTMIGAENYRTLAASYCVPINHTEPYCRIGVLRLRALHNWRQTLPELIKVHQKRSLPAPEQPISPIAVVKQRGRPRKRGTTNG
jgi:hypothetical protein